MQNVTFTKGVPKTFTPYASRGVQNGIPFATAYCRLMKMPTVNETVTVRMSKQLYLIIAKKECAVMP